MPPHLPCPLATSPQPATFGAAAECVSSRLCAAAAGACPAGGVAFVS